MTRIRAAGSSVGSVATTNSQLVSFGEAAFGIVGPEFARCWDAMIGAAIIAQVIFRGPQFPQPCLPAYRSIKLRDPIAAGGRDSLKLRFSIEIRTEEKHGRTG
jgi:hypothetical protein